MTAGGWLEEKRRPVSAVAEQLGWPGDDRKGYRCPACNAETRDGRRGAVYVGREGGWKCYRCDAAGDWCDYASYALGSVRFRDCSPEQRRSVREWFCGPTAVAYVPTAPRPVVHADVSDFWRTCTPLGEHPFAVARGFVGCPDHLARLTPMLPEGWPEWWPAGRSTCWRLVTRGWTMAGDAVNLHGRAVIPPPEFKGRRIKSLWAKGISADGVLFWNGVRAEGADLVIVGEGITDWLSLAMWAENRRNICVYGGVSGGFTALASIDPPSGVSIVAAVDEDKAGDAYLDQIVSVLGHRRILRMRPSKFRPVPQDCYR